MDDALRQRLLQRAQDTLTHSYADYSGVHVAAALMCPDGSIFTGVNVENASFGLTVCAERNAVFNAVGHGHREFTAMAIVSDAAVIQSPCGACRQVMHEFSPEMEVVVQSPAGTFDYTVRELLPAAFVMGEDAHD